MARGWESKAVEAQIEEGKQPAYVPETPSSATLEMKVRQQKLESLRLSRSRVMQQLDRARHSAHREMLLKGLQAIEKEIGEVSSEAKPAAQ